MSSRKSLTSPKQVTKKPSLKERAAQTRDAAGRFLTRAGDADAPKVQSARPQASLGTIPVSSNASPDAYGLQIDANGLGLHAAPGASVLVEPEMPTKAGLAVFYMKGGRGPAIFDLTRNFRPEFARPFPPGSEVMPLIEMVDPVTGEFGRMRADQVGTIHRIIGIFTPADVMGEHLFCPTHLPEMAECPEDMGEHYVEGAAAYPLVRPGETVVYDPSRREPTDGALCVLQWGSGARDVLRTSYRTSGGQGDMRWWVDPINRPSNREVMERRQAAGKLGLLYASDGPYTEKHLRERIVGTVVGILVPRREVIRPQGLAQPPQGITPAADDTAASDQPSPLAQACDQAVLDWNVIQPTSRAENWGDEELDAALDAYGAVFKRAINEPSRNVADVQAKARLLLHDLIEHDVGRSPNNEATYTDDARLTRVILREVAALPSSPTRAPLSDPIFTTIKHHVAARAACIGLDGAQDKEGYEAAHDAAYEALEAVESTQPTTVAGLLALARHMDRYLNEDAGGQNTVEPTAAGHAFVALINACLGLSERRYTGMDQDLGADPIFGAIQAHITAREAFSATVNPQDKPWRRQHGLDTSDEALAPAHAAYDAASDAEAKAWVSLTEVRPTTLSGVLALLRHAEQHAADHDGMADAPAVEEVFGIIADGLAGILRADQDSEPFSVESAATLNFTGYDIDTPLRDPREWAERLSHQALGLHVADRVLRQGRDELATWIGAAAEAKPVADGMLKAMNYAFEEFEGLAKFIDAARARYLIAMSVLAVTSEAQG